LKNCLRKWFFKEPWFKRFFVEPTMVLWHHSEEPSPVPDGTFMFLCVPCYSHLYSLPVSSALVALIVLPLKGTDITQDQVGLCCHGDHLPAVVPLSPRLVRRCAALSVAQGNMDLPVFRQHLATTRGTEETTSQYVAIEKQTLENSSVYKRTYLIQNLVKICKNTRSHKRV